MRPGLLYRISQRMGHVHSQKRQYHTPARLMSWISASIQLAADSPPYTCLYKFQIFSRRVKIPFGSDTLPIQTCCFHYLSPMKKWMLLCLPWIGLVHAQTMEEFSVSIEEVIIDNMPGLQSFCLGTARWIVAIAGRQNRRTA